MIQSAKVLWEDVAGETRHGDVEQASESLKISLDEFEAHIAHLDTKGGDAAVEDLVTDFRDFV